MDSLFSVNGFGADAVAGFGAYLKIDGFNILPVMSISMAVTTFTGQNYGAGKIDRVKKGMWVTIAMGLIYTITNHLQNIGTVIHGSYIFCLLPVWSSSSYTEAADLSTTKVQIWSSVQSEIQSIMFHFEWLR